MILKPLSTLAKIVSISGILIVATMTITAQKYTGSPVTKPRLIQAIKSRAFSAPSLVKRIKVSGTDFEVTPAVEQELLAARAKQPVIDAAKENYRYRQTASAPGRPPVKPPAPVRDVAGENYEQLFYQGLDALARLRMAQSMEQATPLARAVIDAGNQAIRANAARPEAYALVGSAHMVMRSFPEAQRYGQMAIDRGGSLAFPVMHMLGQPHPETLHVGKGFVTVESDNKFFEFYGSEVTGLNPEQDYITNTGKFAIFSMQVRKNGQDDRWYFSPSTTSMPQEASMIMDLIRKNSTGGQ